MFRKCCVPKCNSLRKDIKLHRVPAREEYKRKWLSSLNWDPDRDVSNMFVCHKHFEQRFVNAGTNRLKSDAYPSLFTHLEISSGEASNLCSETDDIKPYTDHSLRKSHFDHTYYSQCQPTEESLERSSPQDGDETGNDDVVVICAYEEYQSSKIEDAEVIIEETIQQSPDQVAFEVTLSSTTIKPTTKDELYIISPSEHSQETHTSAPGSTNQLDLKRHTEQEGQQALHPSENKLHPPASTLNKLSHKCTDKELQKKYRLLNKKYSTLRKSHELLRDRCKRQNMFETLTTGMNPVAKEFFRNQLSLKRSRAVRFSPEVKILALSIIKLSSKCYKLLRKIFVLPSKQTLNSIYHSITGNDIQCGDNSEPKLSEDVLNQLDTILLKTGDEVNHNDELDSPEHDMEENELNQSYTRSYTRDNDKNMTEDELNPTDAKLHITEHEINSENAKLHKTEDEFNPTNAKLYITEYEINSTDVKLHMTEDEFNLTDIKLTVEHMNEDNMTESVKYMRHCKLKQYERQTNILNMQSPDVALISLRDAVVDKPQTFKIRHNKLKVDGFNERLVSNMCKMLQTAGETVDAVKEKPQRRPERIENQIVNIKSRKRQLAQDKRIKIIENITLGGRFSSDV